MKRDDASTKIGALLAASLILACGSVPEPASEQLASEQAIDPAPSAAPTPPATSAPIATPEGVSFGPLGLGETRTSSLPSGGAHHHALELAVGEAFIVEVGQDQIDLEVTVLDPTGQEELVFDSPVARSAPERICLVASVGGQYTLRLRPFGASGGAYTLHLERLRPATGGDRSCDRGTRVFTAAQARRAATGASEALATDYALAHDLWRQAGEPLLAAITLRQAGYVRFTLGQSAQAATRYRQSLASAREAGAAFLEISLLNRLGLALLDLGDLEAAEQALRQARSRAQQTNDRRGEAGALHNLALVDEAFGETHRAIERYQQILPIWRQLGNDIQVAQTEMSLADAYALLEHNQEALHLLADAQATFRRTESHNRLAHALVSIGWVHHLRTRPEDAIAPFREALELYRELGNRNGEAATLDRLGTALRETGDPTAALKAYRESLALSETTGSFKDAANTALNIGCLYQEWGKAGEARSHLADARARLRSVEDARAHAHVEFCQARLEQQAGDLAAALERIEQTLTIIDELRSTARRHGARYRPLWSWQDYAELHLELLMAQYRATNDPRFAVQAFETSDLSRARNLFELVLESQVGVRSQAPRALIERERDIQRRLNATHKEHRESRAAGAAARDVAALERRLGELSLELERARDRIRAADPHFAELAAPRPVRLQQLQAVLRPGTVLLSYALGAEHSYLFAVGRESFDVWPLERRSMLEAQAQALYEALRRSRFDPFQVPLAARRLSSMLLPPEALAAETDRILVVADGMLHYVPMAVLPSPREDSGAGIREQRLLVDDFEIQRLPSASVLEVLSRRVRERTKSSRRVAVFADAVFSDADPRLKPGSRSSSHGLAAPTATLRLPEGPLPRLPHTAREAHAILELATGAGQAFLGFDAAKQVVLSGQIEDFQILHFATHALIDERFPELSGLVLSRRAADGSAIAGDLHLHEIYSLSLDAELVVLSGCQTALGQRVRGDGLVSLTRGFLYAGACQLLVSLWSVDDEATAELMTEFYRGLFERGESSATALRSAQRRMRADGQWRAPYYWASFVLQGTSN